MAKNFFQDMIRIKNEIRKGMPGREMDPKTEMGPTAKESSREPRKENISEPQWPPMVYNKVERQVDIPSGSREKQPRRALWLVALVAVVFLFFAVSFVLTRATIVISPKTVEGSVFKDNLSASKNGDGGLSFDLVILSDAENKTVAGGAVEDVAIPATGTVIIYNNYSSASQRLDINTRLEGSNGKIYKTEKQVVVPGMRGDVPGFVEVQVYAAEAGTEYNSPPLDFQIFGFKGTPKYGKFYARSKTDLTGGLKGKVSVISETKKAIIRDEMRTALEAKLFKRAGDLIPEGFILLDNAFVFKIDSENFDFNSAQGTEIPVSVSGTFSGFLFKETELSAKIVEKVLPKHDESPVYVANLKDLDLTLLNVSNSVNDFERVEFNLSGSPKIVWKLDEAELVAKLLGKNKKDLNQILSQYPNIESANVTLSPFWKKSFPKKANQVKLTINYPN